MEDKTLELMVSLTKKKQKHQIDKFIFIFVMTEAIIELVLRKGSAVKGV